MPTEKRPNLFLVGAQKSATSAMAGWLKGHPQAFMSFPKEPGYLAFGEGGYDFPNAYGRPGSAAQYVVRSESEYLDLFAEAQPEHKVIGEASTWYFAEPGMARRLDEFSPGCKVIVSLRDPAERAYSAWCHARGRDIDPCQTFAESLAAESERKQMEHLLRYHEMGRYCWALKEYREVFDPDRFLVLFYQDIQADPLGEWRKICAFLDIDASHEPRFEQRYNTSGIPRLRFMNTIMRSHRVKTWARRFLPHGLAVSVKNRVEQVNLQDFPPLSDADRAYLRDYYRDEVLELQQLTGRDLTEWLP